MRNATTYSVLIAAFMVIWIGSARGDEAYDSAQVGDFARTRTLLVKELRHQNPKLPRVPDESDVALLHLAAGTGRRNIVELLLAKGEDINARDNEGTTPLFSAAILGQQGVTDFGQRTVAELLLSKGADVNAKDSVYGLSILHYVVSIGRKDMAELLLANKVDIDARAKNGATPHSIPQHYTAARTWSNSFSPRGPTPTRETMSVWARSLRLCWAASPT